MKPRHSDGSAGDANYGKIGVSYSRYRQPDPRIAAQIGQCLGDAKKIINVGAGAGSYEPIDRDVTAIEPSASMRAQRPPHLSQAIDSTAEHLPFADHTFDAAMATFTVHQWADLAKGLQEIRRVTKGPVVIMSCDPAELFCFWLQDYCREALEIEARRYPTIEAIRNGLVGDVEVIPVPIPLDCKDGFNEAYYGRPEMLLDPNARLSCSAWSFVSPATVAEFEIRLQRDLGNGTWDKSYSHLRSQPWFACSLRLIVSR
jgi:SAM-dependent methyltransferase